MHIFIDEAGTGLASDKKPITCVAALIVPDSQVDDLNAWFLALEKENGALIKGRDIQNDLRERILKGILNFDVFIECVGTDIGLHSKDVVSLHKERRAVFIETTPPMLNPFIQQSRSYFAAKIKKTPDQLYVQANLMWSLIEWVLRHATIYYSQKRPEELGAYHWVIDPKQAGKITHYEELWKGLVLPYLQCQPSLKLVEGHDYTHMERFAVPDEDIERLRTDSGKKLRKEELPVYLEKIMTEHLSFPDDKTTPGLRIVDVIVNAIYRCLNTKTNHSTCELVGALFFKRNTSNCVLLQSFEDIPPALIRNRPYKVAILTMEKKNRYIWTS